MDVDVVAIGEPLLEFNAIGSGALRDVSRYEIGWGGDTSNFAIAVARLGGKAGYVCRLGEDEFGQIFLNLWQAEGVDASQVIIEEGGFTGIYFISRSGPTHSFTYYRKDSAASHLSQADLPTEYLAKAKVLHTSGISQAISMSAREAISHAILIAQRAGTLISYDPNVRLKLWSSEEARQVILSTIRQADLVFPSLEDAHHLFGEDHPDKLILEILNLGPKIVGLKMGSQGAIVATSNEKWHFESLPVEAIDTTGAGDAFDGAFIAAYLRDLSLEECGRFANAAAALTTTDWGAVGPIPTRQAVERYLSRA